MFSMQFSSKMFIYPSQEILLDRHVWYTDDNDNSTNLNDSLVYIISYCVSSDHFNKSNSVSFYLVDLNKIKLFGSRSVCTLFSIKVTF